METQDHHCVWLNNCVSRRNYRFFFSFIATGTLLALFLLGALFTHILLWMTRNHTSFGAAINQWRGAFAMVIYAILILPYPASLAGYHCFLVARGESTREYLNSHKFMKKDRHRPFSQSNFFRNFQAVLFRPRTPTYMRFKSRHHEGDQTLGATKRTQQKAGKASRKGDLEMKDISGGANQLGFQGPGGRRPLDQSKTGEA